MRFNPFAVNRRAIKAACDFEMAMDKFRAMGIKPPVDEVLELARTTPALTLGEAADRVYWKHAGVEKPRKSPCVQCGKPTEAAAACGKCVRRLIDEGRQSEAMVLIEANNKGGD